MADDPKFSKEQKVDQPRRYEEYLGQDTGKAREAFKSAKDNEEGDKTRARQRKSPAKKTDQPRLEYNMKGPAGAAVRSQVSQQNAIRRSKLAAARGKSQDLQKQADRSMAGAKETAKQGRDPSAALKPAVSQAKDAKNMERDARLIERVNRLIERVNRLKLAMDSPDLAKSKDDIEK